MKLKNICLTAALVSALFQVNLCGAQNINSDQAKYLAPPITGISTDDTLNNHHAKITQDLISMVNHNPELKLMLEKSIAKAKAINPDKATNPAQSLEEFYSYVDWASTALPWAILPHADQHCDSLYDSIDQSLDYFYFICDIPLEELKGKGLYNNSLQYVEPYRTWMINFTTQYGNFLNTTASWSPEYYERAKQDKSFKLDGNLYEDPKNWHTFNQFFARYLSSPDQRPVAGLEDDSVVVSPADSKPQGIWKINRKGQLLQHKGVNVKSRNFNSIKQLLGNSKYREAFNGGTMTHTFLDVNDYHRFHFPVSGVIKEVLTLPADDAIGGVTVWDPTLRKYVLQCDVPGWQMLETRALVVIETKSHGLVAVMPIGMSQVSSVCFEDTVKVGATVQKGDMLGCFLFGGSDIVLLFQKQVTFDLTVPKAGVAKYQHINMGEQYGKLTAAK